MAPAHPFPTRSADLASLLARLEAWAATAVSESRHDEHGQTDEAYSILEGLAPLLRGAAVDPFMDEPDPMLEGERPEDVAVARSLVLVRRHDVQAASVLAVTLPGSGMVDRKHRRYEVGRAPSLRDVVEYLGRLVPEVASLVDSGEAARMQMDRLRSDLAAAGRVLAMALPPRFEPEEDVNGDLEVVEVATVDGRFS